MEKMNYEIAGVKYEQTELTWQKDKKLIQLYNQIQSTAFKNEELRLKDLQPLLLKYNLLNRFFAIILKPKFGFKYLFSGKWISRLTGSLNLDHATNSQIGQIFQDFFLLNQQFATKLKELGTALGLIATEAGKMAQKAKPQ